MRRSLAFVLGCCLASAALAADEGAFRSPWHAYATTAAAPGPKSLAEPAFAAGGAIERPPAMNLKPGGACGASELEVCLDSTGRIAVPGAKRFLPGLPGLKPERLTLKRSGIVLGYTF